jgi:hypothetical protein
MQLGKSQFGRQIKGKFQSVLLKEKAILPSRKLGVTT